MCGDGAFLSRQLPSTTKVLPQDNRGHDLSSGFRVCDHHRSNEEEQRTLDRSHDGHRKILMEEVRWCMGATPKRTSSPGTCRLKKTALECLRPLAVGTVGRFGGSPVNPRVRQVRYLGH